MNARLPAKPPPAALILLSFLGFLIKKLKKAINDFVLFFFLLILCTCPVGASEGLQEQEHLSPFLFEQLRARARNPKIMFSDTRITCAYLFIISRYGYPPPVTATVQHIREMAAAGFTSMELEGIGRDNIRYLFENRQQVADTLDAYGIEVPVFCTVLPGMGAVADGERLENLEFFEMGCETARFLGAAGVLDNGPLLPLHYPADQPVKRHYNGETLASLLPPPGFEWPVYWQELTGTFREACRIAARYGLD